MICGISGWIQSGERTGQLLPKFATGLEITLFTISEGEGSAKTFPEITRIRFHLPGPFCSHLFHVPQTTHVTMFRRKQKVFQILSHVRNSRFWEGYRKGLAGKPMINATVLCN